MSTNPRVAIIGAGIAGVTTALALQEAGCTAITLFEQEEPAFGSSGRSAGVVETQYLDRPSIRVRHFGLEYFERFSHDHGIHLTRTGYLRLARHTDDLKRFIDSLSIQREFGITDPVILTPEEVVSRWPRLRMTDRVGAVFGPSDGHIESAEFTRRAAHLAVQRGARLQSGVTLRAAELTSAGAWLLRTDSEVFEADVVVNAAGPWAGRIAALFGAEVPLNNQLRPKANLTHDEAMSEPLPFVMDYVPGSGTDGVYFRSETPTELFVGIHTDEALEEDQDPEAPLVPAPTAFVERCLRLLKEQLRTPDGLKVGRTWTGLYAMSPDHRPIVGSHPEAPNVVHVMAAGGTGIQLAPAMAKVASELVMSGTTTVFPDVDWSLARFDTLA